jgi:hypothetical protein
MPLTEQEEQQLREELENHKKEVQKYKSEMGRLKKSQGGAGKKEGEEGDEKTKKTQNDDQNDDLFSKAKKETETQNKSANDTKKIENALRFNLGVQDFVKNNKDILPSDVEGILKVAEKENYDTALAKANAIKVGVVNSFFSVQANLDLLTPAQKIQLEDFQKLTKNGKEERAEHIFENIFEPALETFKKLKKAEELGKARSGFSSGSSVENDYKERLMKMARKTHLREKGE